MTRARAFAFALALFLVGVLVGGLGVRLLDRSDGWQPAPRRPERFLERLSRDLDLTPDQRQRIEAIVHDAHATADAMHDEMLPRVREHLQGPRERIREVLTPEQQAVLDRLFERQRWRAERFLMGEGRRPPSHRPGARRGPPPDRP
jgi:Spy/CpxP family protein refolding chaperone